MNKQKYLAAIQFLDAHKNILKPVQIAQKTAETAIAVAYTVFIFMLIYGNNRFWVKSVVTCGIGLITVSLLRICVNKKRPYERYGFAPLIKKDTAGKSFPSRHAFSGAIIAVNIWAISPVCGMAVAFLTVVISFLRVVMGVHYISDVIFGGILGAIIGILALMI